MAADVGVARVHDLDAAVRNGADIGRGAADIDGDQVVAAAQHAFGPAADHAARRARHQDADRLLRAGFHGGDAAIRLDYAQIGAETVLREPALQVIEIERGLRADKSVHRRGRESLVFADHIRDFRGRADIGVRHFRPHDFGGAPLVRVVEKRKQKSDDDGLDAAALEQADRFKHFVLVERDFDLAVRRQDALGHCDAVAPLDQRLLLPRHLEVEREIVWPLVAADMKDITEIARREHSDFSTGMLDRDVGRDRGTVHDQRHVIGAHAGDLAEFAQALEHAL